MLLGRLEFLTLLVLLIPAFWKPVTAAFATLRYEARRRWLLVPTTGPHRPFRIRI